MAYRRRGRKFGRERDQRNQMMRSLARSVILHERVRTTESRAKSIRPYVEKMVSKAMTETLATRRLLLSRLCNDTMTVKKLFEVLAPRYKDRNGGYLRVVKVESRPGSGRSSAIIEFV